MNSVGAAKVSSDLWKLGAKFLFLCLSTGHCFPRLCFRSKHLLENCLLCAGTLFSTCAVPASLQRGSLVGLHSHKVTEEKEVCACTTI